MTLDSDALAAALTAMMDAPARLAALVRRFEHLETKIDALSAALPPLLVSVTEAAQAFKVSVPTMRRWVRGGNVPTVRVGATVRVDLSRVRGSDAGEVLRLATTARRPAGAAAFGNDNGRRGGPTLG